MTALDLWSHEIRGAGRAALLAPPAFVLATLLLAAFGARLGSRAGTTAWMLLWAVETGIPLIAGLAAASVIGRDRATELQLSLPARYRSTVLRRLAVIAGWAALCALALSSLLIVTGWWDVFAALPAFPLGTAAVPAGQLTWLAPAVWLTALGLLAAAVFRSTVAATTTVAVVWVFEQVLSGPLRESAAPRLLYLSATARGAAPGAWLPNRLGLICTALPLLGAAWALLGNTERILGGERG
ncbi:hypothetical protein N5079_21250 [Planotetraspora sp. A-T 1434]|uniref:hypothetical protein n=1 Tax=Planotetraspora sp. A-T 1434 TaxID=2979219 RepID=UPI0021C11571|nr:hypothetical protein [Planotetraspora sp. A-T 1434]MCT9932734.1 hypothetical protein [Planotetraspora sp. A-T 1434]